MVHVDLTWIPVGAGATHPRARAGSAAHVLPKGGGIWKSGGHDIARRHANTANLHRVGGDKVEFLESLQHLDEFSAQPVLERDPVDLDPPRNQDHLFVFDVDAFDGTDAVGKGEDLRLGEWCRREPSPLAFVDHRRVQTFLDRRPDRERRGEVMAVDHEVGAITYSDFGDVTEQMVGGVARGDVGETRLDPHAHQRHQPAVSPYRRLGELGVTEATSGLRIRLGGVWLGEMHGHVHVVASGGKGALEDRRVESWVTGVEHHVGAGVPRESGDGAFVGGIDGMCTQTRSPVGIEFTGVDGFGHRTS